MKAIKWLIGVVLLLAAVVVIGGLFLPSTFSVERSVQVAAPPDKVFALVEDPRQWQRWTVWNRRDPAMKMSYSGAAHRAPARAGPGRARTKAAAA